MKKVCLVLLSVCGFLAGCSSIDCPMNNRVMAVFRMAGTNSPLADTLTVSTPLSEAEGNDSVLVNRLTGADSIKVPMSYARQRDTYYFRTVRRADAVVVDDTVWVEKTDSPHFESVDCNPVMFHEITRLTYTRNAIDSIKINNKSVTYDATKAHFLVYFKSDGLY